MANVVKTSIATPPSTIRLLDAVRKRIAADESLVTLTRSELITRLVVAKAAELGVTAEPEPKPKRRTTK